MRLHQVVAPGSKVLIDGQIHARVEHVRVDTSFHAVYQLSWWDGRTRMFADFDRDEFATVPEGPTIAIGFHGRD